jgi:parvulin-like peptidyl-prolyl isomerase
MSRPRFVTAVALCLAPTLLADERLPPPAAAVVNGEAVAETAVQRALRNVPPEHQAKARQDIVNHLVDNLLIDQHLRTKVQAPDTEVDHRLKKIKEEAEKNGLTFDKVLAQYNLTEAELRQQVTADLRWENFVKTRLDDKQLEAFFTANREGFDGSQVRGKHILVAVPEGSAPVIRTAAQAKLAGFKDAIEKKAAQALTKANPPADPLARNELRLRVLGDAFGELAVASSDCPSKKNGGDLGWFPRLGHMVEPFAKAAFALQPGQMSEPVETTFGYHLILVTARQPGREVKFDEVKDEVRDFLADRVRGEMLPDLRKAAKIQVAARK